MIRVFLIIVCFLPELTLAQSSRIPNNSWYVNTGLSVGAISIYSYGQLSHHSPSQGWREPTGYISHRFDLEAGYQNRYLNLGILSSKHFGVTSKDTKPLVVLGKFAPNFLFHHANNNFRITPYISYGYGFYHSTAIDSQSPQFGIGLDLSIYRWKMFYHFQKILDHTFNYDCKIDCQSFLFNIGVVRSFDRNSFTKNKSKIQEESPNPIKSGYCNFSTSYKRIKTEYVFDLTGNEETAIQGFAGFDLESGLKTERFKVGLNVSYMDGKYTKYRPIGLSLVSGINILKNSEKLFLAPVITVGKMYRISVNPKENAHIGTGLDAYYKKLYFSFKFNKLYDGVLVSKEANDIHSEYMYSLHVGINID